MTTWQDEFQRLAAEQGQALNHLWKANTLDELKTARRELLTTMNRLREFLHNYRSAGMPDHESQMTLNESLS